MKKKRQHLAPFVMLLAGAIASITMFVMEYGLAKMLGNLLLVLVAFYVLGAVVAAMIGRFEAQNEAVLEAQALEEALLLEMEMEEMADGDDQAADMAWDDGLDDELT